MPKLSGNKGEWSEIYAFLRLLEVKNYMRRMPNLEFKNAADVLYQEIICTTASAFGLPDTEEFLDTLKIGVLKAKSTDKAEIGFLSLV